MWRAVKQRWRRSVGEKNVALLYRICVECMDGLGENRDVNGLDAIQRRIMRTLLIRRFIFWNPGNDPPSENTVQKKKWKQNDVPDLKSVPDFGANLSNPTVLLHAQLYAHHLNQARLKQYRRKEVLFCFLFPFVFSTVVSDF